MLIVILTSCSRKVTPLPDLPPWPTSVPTSAPSVQMPGWEETILETICLTAQQSFSYGANNARLDKTVPLEKTVTATLSDIGLQVVGPRETCDANLRIIMKGQALSGNYNTLGKCYLGASINTRMILTAPGRPRHTWQLNEEKEPPASTSSCRREPESAPFIKLQWEERIFESLVEIWGKNVYGPGIIHLAYGSYPNELVKEPLNDAIPYFIQALQSNDAEIRGRAASVLGRIWSSGEEEAVPFLIQALRDEPSGPNIGEIRITLQHITGLTHEEIRQEGTKDFWEADDWHVWWAENQSIDGQ